MPFIHCMVFMFSFSAALASSRRHPDRPQPHQSSPSENRKL